MKKIKRVIAVVAIGLFLLSSQSAVFAEEENTAGKTAAYYIQAVIDRLEKDYRFGADKEAMYKAVLAYVMNENPQLLEGAIDAVVDTLDKHSDYMTRAELEAFINGVEQAYVGIGVTIVQIADGVEITEVNPDGGAFDAGLLVGDIIVAVGGQQIAGADVSAVSQLVRGEAGTTVILTVRRGSFEQDIPVMRSRIFTETVGYTIDKNKIGYLVISSFSSTTPDSVKLALASMKDFGVKKILIDVRNNPGGELESVTKVLSQFVPKGKVLTTIQYNNEDLNRVIKSEATSSKRPDRDIVILANENSASAAELFAGAMQNLGLATVVGETTQGKGSMQIFMNLLSTKDFALGDIKLSVAEFTLPDGGKINGVGIKPNIRVKNIMVPYDATGLTPMTMKQRYTVGDKGEDVRAIEERLSVLGYFSGQPDDTFDELTAAATEAFQAKVDLFAYGVMDYTTQN
ncbi:MAG: PDZ domain-containing protein, partial [Clostridia bacterium]|nr:PDZ domain-containing protein [Clostridia bacterium]